MQTNSKLMATINNGTVSYSKTEKELINTSKKEILHKASLLEGQPVDYGKYPICLQEAMYYWGIHATGLFGQAEPRPTVLKCLEEAQELSTALEEGNLGQAKKEAVDVLMTLTRVFTALNMEVSDVVEMMVNKTAENEKRKWIKNEDGTFSSIKIKNIDIGPWTDFKPEEFHFLSGHCSLALINMDGYCIGIKSENNQTKYAIKSSETENVVVYDSFSVAVNELKYQMIRDLSVEKLKKYIIK